MHRERKRKLEPGTERLDTEMRLKLRQQHTERTEDKKAWKGASWLSRLS